MGPLQESYWVNDSIMIFNTLDGDLLTYNDKNNYIIDRVKISDIVEGIPTDRAKKLGDFNFSIVNNDVFVGFRFFNDIFKFKLADGFKFKRENKLPLSPENINENNIYDNYGYYSFIEAGDKYVLAQYYGHRLKLLQPFPVNMGGRNLKYDLILLDTDLNPICIYKPETDILRVFLDTNKERIYYWDAFEDFDKLKFIKIQGSNY